MSLLCPKEYHRCTYNIPFESLVERGIRGVIFDIDNTLVAHGAPADEGAVRFIKKLYDMGLRTCLISNNHEDRVKPFAEAVGSPYVYDAGKPLSRGYREGCRIMGISPSETAFVGDQIYTDILGANLSGVHSILVSPIYDDPEFQIKIKRVLEKPVLHFCKAIRADKKDVGRARKADYILIGYPLGHSKFAELHSTLNYQNGVDSRAALFEMHEPLEDVIRRFHTERVPGVSVTMPFKQEVMKLLPYIDDQANAAGAVNTLVWHEEGYYGYNTDITGLAKCLENGGINITGRDVLIIGAGGAARAAMTVCLNSKVASLTIINRTRKKAEELADRLIGCGADFPVTVLDYSECDKADKPEYIAIQCTGLGMDDKKGQLPPLTEDLYRRITEACDAIYNPPRTAFLDKVGSYGGKTVNGYDMFRCQADAARELWGLPG